VSISIDPLNDNAAALSAWRARFGARPNWVAGSPPVQHANVLLDFLRSRANNEDRHTAQTFLFDMQARLAYRCAELASAGDIARIVREMARLG
jgi:protein SCO1/2